MSLPAQDEYEFPLPAHDTGLAQHEFELTLPRSRTRTRPQLPPVFHEQSTSTYDGERYGGGRFATFHVRRSTRRRAPLASAFPVDALSDEPDDYTSPPLPAADASPPTPPRHQRTPPTPPFHSVPMVRSESVPVLTYAELERVGGTRGWASARPSLTVPTAEVPGVSESAPTSPTCPQSAAAAAAASAIRDPLMRTRHTRSWPRGAYTAFSDPFTVPRDDLSDDKDYYGSTGAAATHSWTRPRSAHRARHSLPLAALWSPTAASSALSVSTSASPLPRTPPHAASPSEYPYGSYLEGGDDIELQVEVDDADLDLDIVMDTETDADGDGDDTDRASPATSCGLSPMLRSAALGISSSAGHSPALPGSAALGVALSLSSSWSSSLTAAPYGEAHPWRQAA